MEESTKKPIAVGVYLLFGIPFLWGQSTSTTTFTQTGGGGCHVTGCTNAPISDGETFSFNDTQEYYGAQNILVNLYFRGIQYAMSGKGSGYQTEDLSNGQGFAIHEDFTVHCLRGCSNTWKDGSLRVPNTYVGVIMDRSIFYPGQYPNWPPTAFGGQVYRSGGTYVEGPSSGTVQVGLAVPAQVDTVVTLTTSDAAFTVPERITIPAGQLFANGTITAAAFTGRTEIVATVLATFPDGSTAIITVTDDPGPAPVTD